ncbi:hypothetical protein G4X40_21110 [Rhodococcus sp. D2-41]|uniref:hypothetical protein n=1 Tax=Speluncibacter jeojiensis TaxID=2710754 RepID=UPI00240F0701|nr:hypothetical protein [Rhodococcus sp. D2-41]MDG3012644.1 hypothetical protein [Rhodococcus sp. D2-41]
MAERFAAQPTEIGGMACLADASADHLIRARSLMNAGTPGPGYSGLLELLAAPIEQYTAAAAGRVQRRHDVTFGMANELRHTAWHFSSQDHANAQALAQQHSSLASVILADSCAMVTVYDGIPGSEAFAVRDEPDFTAPPAAECDVRGLIDSTTGILKDLDDAVRTVTQWVGGGDGWSPIEAAIKPIAGNWAELERSGKAFAKAGTACEQVAGNLRDGARRLDTTWDGKAAIAYQDYVEHLAKALAWEGPLGRLAERVLKATSDQIQETATALLDKISQVIQDRIIGAGLKDVFIRNATKVVPGGWIFQMIEIGHAIVDIWMAANELINDIKNLIADAVAVIDAIENPADAIANALAEKLQPLQEKVDELQDNLEMAGDVAAVSDVTALTGAPTSNFAVGPGEQPWQDAS